MAQRTAVIVGQCASPHSSIAQRLARWGVQCLFAKSYTEARSLLQQRACDLILSDLQLADGSARRLAALLEGSPVSLFCSYPIEDSCLWIPVVARGRDCWGAAPLRPREFGVLLRRAFAERRPAGAS